MMPWIQVYSNLPGHKKLYALSKALGIKRKYETVGIIVSLWLWAAKNAPDGDITDFPVEALEDAVPGFRGLPKLYTALLDTGWLDQTEDGRIIFHDWEEYAGLLMDALDNQKKKTRERVRKYRAGKSGKRNGKNHPKEEADVCNVTGNATETLSNAPTRPDQTKPDHITTTLREKRAADYYRETVTGMLSERSAQELDQFVEAMGDTVCIRAMEMAMDNGKTSWSYIRAILSNWQSAGVHSVQDVESMESRRAAQRSGEDSTAAPGGATAEDLAANEQLKRFLKELKEGV